MSEEVISPPMGIYIGNNLVQMFDNRLIQINEPDHNLTEMEGIVIDDNGWIQSWMPNQNQWLWKNGDIENRMQKVIDCKCRRDIDLDKRLSVLRRNGSTVREMFKVVRCDI